MAKNKDYVKISTAEYEELINYKTKINLLLSYIIEAERTEILKNGTEKSFYSSDIVNSILGCSYINYRNEKSMKEYKQREKGETKCE